jgi:ribosomal protein L11 methylase PrmA
MTTEEIINEAAKYKWYHKIELCEGFTTPGVELFDRICTFIYQNQRRFGYEGKSVLDVGARDGLHSIRASRLGAKTVTAIDNDISMGAVNLAFPLLAKNATYRHQNLYSLPQG